MPHDPRRRAPVAPVLVAWLALAPGLVHAAVALPVYRTFGDWTVACDVVGDCEARGFTDDGDGSLAMRMVRAAGRDAEPVFEIVDAPEHAGAGLTLDGHAFPTSARIARSATTAADDTPAQMLTLRGVAPLQALTAAARRAHRLGVSGSGSTGSLSGFNAAMLYIDDAQGRIDTPGAIARPGHATAAVPGPRPLPAPHAVRPRGRPLAEKDARRYVQALARRDDDCEGDLDDVPASVDPLDDTRVIAMVPCWRGAYQTGYAVFVGPRADPAKATPIHLPYPTGGQDDGGVLTEGTFDPKTGRLSMFAKGRGIADCGASGDWTWDGRGFALVSYTLLDRCGWPEPGDFLTLWRSTESEAGR